METNALCKTTYCYSLKNDDDGYDDCDYDNDN